MIIPANENIARKIAKIPMHFKVMLDYLDYLSSVHCHDDLVILDVQEDNISIDIPSKSRLNGVIKLMEVMNCAWTYDPNNLNEKTLDLADSPKGNFLCLRKGTNTTDMHHNNRRVCKYENLEVV